jgi:preprotein translocase subunit SecE
MDKVSTEYTKFDTFKWLIIGLIVVGGASANFVWVSEPILYRVLGIVALSLASVALAASTKRGKEAFQFLKDARTEIRKVVWPEKQETLQTTMIVVGVVMVMAVLLWIIDAILLRIMAVFTS